MKFISIQFPNMTISNDKVNIQFVDGEYNTENINEIELLKSAGFPFEGKLPNNKK